MAMEHTMLISWTAAEIESQIERHPRLGLALVQVLVRRSVDLKERLEVAREPHTAEIS